MYHCMMYAAATILVFLTVILGPDKCCDGASNSGSFKRFKACIKQCSKVNMECNNEIKNLWADYFTNRMTIMHHSRHCCLLNEFKEDAHSDDNFEACARSQCGAMLWGSDFYFYLRSFPM